MPSRSDISDNLIHFTRGLDGEDAMGTLLKIVGEGHLIAGNGMIRGNYECVCFTEAPLPALTQGFVNTHHFTRYAPFGLMFEKTWVYSRGGRPVIYQSDAEFERLREEMRWRHVRYEPLSSPRIDFTWEREWRIHTPNLPFSPQEAVLVVPDSESKDFLVDIWDSQQDLEVEYYSTVFDSIVVDEFMRKAFPWRVVTLQG